MGTVKLNTKRLCLRPWEMEDAQAMFENWASDDEVTRYLLWFSHKELEETEEVVQSWVKLYEDLSYYHWVVVLKETGEPIGSVNLFDLHRSFLMPWKMSGELGYCFGRKWWGQGFATEAVSAVLDFMFRELGLAAAVARHDHRNPASGRVMRRLHMEHVGYVQKAERGRDGKWIDCDFYRLKKREYFRLAGGAPSRKQKHFFRGENKFM